MNYSTAQSKQESSSKIVQAFIPSWVRRILPSLKGARCAVLVAYWSHANRDGFAWPSIELLGKETRYGKNTLKPARSSLVQLGLLLPVKQYRDADGRWRKKVFSVFTGAQQLDHGTVVQFLGLTAAQKLGSTAAQKMGQEGFPSRSSPIRRTIPPTPLQGRV